MYNNYESYPEFEIFLDNYFFYILMCHAYLVQLNYNYFVITLVSLYILLNKNVTVHTFLTQIKDGIAL